MIGRALAVGAVALTISGAAHAETRLRDFFDFGSSKRDEQASTEANTAIEQAIAKDKRADEAPKPHKKKRKVVKRAKVETKQPDVAPASTSEQGKIEAKKQDTPLTSISGEQASGGAKQHSIYGFETGMSFEQATVNAKKYGCGLQRVDNGKKAPRYICNKNYDPPVDLIFGPHSNKLLFMMVGHTSELPAEIAAQDLCRKYAADCDSYKVGESVVLDPKTDTRFYVSDHHDGRLVVVLVGLALAFEEEKQAPGGIFPIQ